MLFEVIAIAALFVVGDAGLPMMHSLHVFDALGVKFTPFKSVLSMELTL